MNIINLPIPTSKEIHKFLPCSHTLITAPTGSGKTILLLNLIIRGVFPYKKFYDKIFIFSPTIGLDNSWNLLEGKEKYILIDELSQEAVEEILENQKFNIETDGKKKTKFQLIICDDYGGDLKNIKYKFLVSLLMKLRHYNIHLFLTTQSYRAVPRGMRLQFNYHLIFKVSPQELKIISQEVNSSIDEEIFKEMYIRAIEERPFNFLYIDIRKQNYYSGFKKKINYKKIEKDEKLLSTEII
jgi:hypothetical protein